MTNETQSTPRPIRRILVGAMMGVIVGLPIVTVWLLLPTWREPCICEALLNSQPPSFWWPPSWREDHKIRLKLLSLVSMEFDDIGLTFRVEDGVLQVTRKTVVEDELDQALAESRG